MDVTTGRSRVVLIAAVVVLMGVAGAALAWRWPGGRDSDSGTAAGTAAASGPVVPITACPANWGAEMVATDPWVPVPPSVTRASSRLVPDSTPSAALVCGYTGPTTGLTAHVTLAGDLGPVAAALTGLPRKTGDPMCALDLAFTDDDDYLVGLTYPEGTVWVGAPHNHCTGATNGAFTTTTNVGADVAAWLAAGHFAVPTDADPAAPVTPCPGAGGRLGQDAAMVPDTPVSLTICVADGVSDERAVPVAPARIAEVAADLNALPTVVSTSQCQGPTQGDLYVLVFGYPSGPGVRVSAVAGCDPPVDNGSLQATGTGDLLPLLADLTR